MSESETNILPELMTKTRNSFGEHKQMGYITKEELYATPFVFLTAFAPAYPQGNSNPQLDLPLSLHLNQCHGDK